MNAPRPIPDRSPRASARRRTSRDESAANAALTRLSTILLLACGAGTSLAVSSPSPFLCIATSASFGWLVQAIERVAGATRTTLAARTIAPTAILFVWISRGSFSIDSTAHAVLGVATAMQVFLAAAPQVRPLAVFAAIAGTLHLVPLAFTLDAAPFLALAAGIGLLGLRFWIQAEWSAFPDPITTRGASRRIPRDATLSTRKATGRFARRTITALGVSGVWLGVLVFLLAPRVSIRALLPEPPEPSSSLETPVSASGTESGSSGSGSTPESVTSELGFQEDAFLSNLGRIGEDDTIVLRVALTNGNGVPWDAGGAISIRGIGLDRWITQRWVNSTALRFETLRDDEDGRRDGYTTVLDTPIPGAVPVRQRYELAFADTPTLFALREPSRVRFPVLSRDPQGNLRFPRVPDDLVRYEVESLVVPKELPTLRSAVLDRSDSRNLQVPELSPRLRGLARSIAAGFDVPYDQCRAIERHLRQRCQYDLAFEAAPDIDIVEDFLFTSQRGYCIHFASSMVLMLRSLGIPARVVGGYSTTETAQAANEFIVRRSDSHAWVEVPFEGYGWIPFDPSPVPSARGGPVEAGLWASFVGFLTDLSESSRRELMSALGRAAGPVALWLAIALVVLLIARVVLGRRRRGASHLAVAGGPVEARFYDAFLAAAARRGLYRQSAETPGEFASRARVVLPADAVDFVTRAFCATRYGGRAPREEERGRIRSAIERIEASESADSEVAPQPQRPRSPDG